MGNSVLILGGTTEARQLAGRLAQRGDIEVTLSLAGRTERPVDQGVPVRSGGFGGADGLAGYLADKGVDLLIDATHPYAARISANAAEASRQSGVPMMALRRAGWLREPGDRWTLVDGSEAAVGAIGEHPRRVFLALGRQELLPFQAAPQHNYLVRSVDPVEPPLDVPHIRYILARGPFDEATEEHMLKAERIEVVVAKNSGGNATYGKIAAARKLGIEVILFRRPALPDVPSGESVGEVEAMALHVLGLAKRGE